MSITVTYINRDIKKYKSFKEIAQIPYYNLIFKLNCYNNQLTLLPDNMNFPNLLEFYCCNNNLTVLPDNMNFPNLQYFICSYNQLTALPLCILNYKNLQQFTYLNNQIELSLQIAQFIDRIKNNQKKKRAKDRERKKRRKIKLLAQSDENNV